MRVELVQRPLDLRDHQQVVAVGRARQLQPLVVLPRQILLDPDWDDCDAVRDSCVHLLAARRRGVARLGLQHDQDFRDSFRDVRMFGMQVQTEHEDLPDNIPRDCQAREARVACRSQLFDHRRGVELLAEALDFDDPSSPQGTKETTATFKVVPPAALAPVGTDAPGAVADPWAEEEEEEEEEEAGAGAADGGREFVGVVCYMEVDLAEP
eukprot:SAG22_NODE_2441_length_2573_cov_35.168957_3_plen_210_part_00